MSADHLVRPEGGPEPGARRSHDSTFIALVRALAREAGITRPVSDEDACAVLDHFWVPDAEYRPLPEEDGPALWAELQRRSESARPTLSAGTVGAYLRQRWGQEGS
jgi:hypothetical protein